MSSPSGPPAQHIVFLTLTDYSMIALSNALEVLRMANRVSDRELYRWTIATLDGRPALASNGLPLSPTVALAQVEAPDIVFVCGGIRVREACDAIYDAVSSACRDKLLTSPGPEPVRKAIVLLSASDDNQSRV